MQALKILIDNQQKKRVPTDKIRQKIKQILDGLGFNAHEISILITDDVRIKELNQSFRGVDKATNVLAFPMQEGHFSDITPGLLGDVVISCDTAVREAESAGIELMERMSQLLIHGILHLVGYDHETGDFNAKMMEEKSIELLRMIEPNSSLDYF